MCVNECSTHVFGADVEVWLVLDEDLHDLRLLVWLVTQVRGQVTRQMDASFSFLQQNHKLSNFTFSTYFIVIVRKFSYKGWRENLGLNF